jgi:hypothetical protein
MARELDSEMLRRLQTNYDAMSDAELQQMAEKPDDLTDMALEILRGEMARRRLVAPTIDAIEVRATPQSFDESPLDSLGIHPTRDEPKSASVRSGWISLRVFYDAIELGRACDFLEEQEVDFDIRDLSKPRSVLTPFERPVEMDLDVRRVDQSRAILILREKMGLFPLQEVDVADEPLDDGAVSTLGDFGLRADAEEIGRVLEQANIWHRIVANEDGTPEAEDCFSLQVREINLMAAGELVEQAMNLPEA